MCVEDACNGQCGHFLSLPTASDAGFTMAVKRMADRVQLSPHLSLSLSPFPSLPLSLATFHPSPLIPRRPSPRDPSLLTFIWGTLIRSPSVLLSIFNNKSPDPLPSFRLETVTPAPKLGSSPCIASHNASALDRERGGEGEEGGEGEGREEERGEESGIWGRDNM